MVVRWTDRCPAPVLALSLGLALNVLFLPLGAFNANVVPLFGTFVTGPAAFVLRLLLGLLCAALAWAVYRLRPAAWWAVLALWSISTASTAMTFRDAGNLRRLYEKMGLPAEQVDMTMSLYSQAWGGSALFLIIGASLLGGLLYLLWIRKYFFPPVPPPTAMNLPPAPGA